MDPTSTGTAGAAAPNTTIPQPPPHAGDPLFTETVIIPVRPTVVSTAVLAETVSFTASTTSTDAETDADVTTTVLPTGLSIIKVEDPVDALTHASQVPDTAQQLGPTSVLSSGVGDARTSDPADAVPHTEEQIVSRPHPEISAPIVRPPPTESDNVEPSGIPSTFTTLPTDIDDPLPIPIRTNSVPIPSSSPSPATIPRPQSATEIVNPARPSRVTNPEEAEADDDFRQHWGESRVDEEITVNATSMRSSTKMATPIPTAGLSRLDGGDIPPGAVPVVQGGTTWWSVPRAGETETRDTGLLTSTSSESADGKCPDRFRSDRLC